MLQKRVTILFRVETLWLSETTLFISVNLYMSLVYKPIKPDIVKYIIVCLICAAISQRFPI